MSSLTVSPSELSTAEGTRPTLRVTNVDEVHAVAFSVKAAPRTGAQHRFLPTHEGILAPGESTDITVEIDDTVRPDASHKDKLVVVYLALESAVHDAVAALRAHRNVADLLGNASRRVSKLKVNIVHSPPNATVLNEQRPPMPPRLVVEEESSGVAAPALDRVADLTPRTVVRHLLKSDADADESRGKVLFATFFGSRAYNLSAATASRQPDVDVYGVFAAPLRDILAVRTHITAAAYEDTIIGQRKVAAG
jgi:hypothetical protein